MNSLSLFGIFISAALVNNILLIRFIGLCPFFGVSRKIETSLGMSMAVFFVMTMSAVITWIIYHFVLLPYELRFLRTAVFILTIASFVQLVELFLKKSIPALYNALGIYLPLITTNCAILGVTFLNIDYDFGFLQMFVHTIGVAGGYILTINVFASIREKLDFAPLPGCLKGHPIAFFLAALMSLAFLGFKGLFGL